MRASMSRIQVSRSMRPAYRSRVASISGCGMEGQYQVPSTKIAP